MQCSVYSIGGTLSSTKQSYSFHFHQLQKIGFSQKPLQKHKGRISPCQRFQTVWKSSPVCHRCITLIQKRQMFPITLKPKTDLHCKTIDWLLYDVEHWSLMGVVAMGMPKTRMGVLGFNILYTLTFSPAWWQHLCGL